MPRKGVRNLVMSLGLGALLTVGLGAWGVVKAAPPAPAPLYTGQVQEIKIDQCGLEPGTCEGTLVLAQAGGREVALAIPAGTEIQRGAQRLHLEELGVGNYVMVQARPLPRETGNPLSFGLDQPSRMGDRVGTSMGERSPTLQESSEE